MIGDTPVGTIVTTHRHYDHWQALPELQTRTGAVVVAHPADADELPVEVGHRAEHGEVLTFGDCSVSLIHLRGHTPGSLAVLYDAGGKLAGSPHVFTGDSLFPGGVGKTNSPEDFTSLIDDVTERLFTGCPTRRGCIQATATTRRWGRSGRTSVSGGNADGDQAAQPASAGPPTRSNTGKRSTRAHDARRRPPQPVSSSPGSQP